MTAPTDLTATEAESSDNGRKPRDKTPDLSFLAKTRVKKTQLVEAPRGRTAEPNPMFDHFKRSWDEKTALQIACEAAQAKYVERLLRRAANELNLGVSVQVFDKESGDGTPYSLRQVMDGQLRPDAPVYVAFQAKERRKHNKGKENVTDAV